MDNRYERGKIYKIVDNTADEIYIGSTCEPTLARRLANHRSKYNHYLKAGKGGCLASFGILENNNYGIFLIENFPCKSRDELLAQEGYHIENNICVNKVKPIRTEQEKSEYNTKYSADHKDKVQQYLKQYRADNKDKAQHYYEINKEEINTKRIQYRAENKEEINAKNKHYYQNNKETINAKQCIKIECECGGQYTHQNCSTHFKTPKHQKYCQEINHEKNN